jgi:hypothetical protein
MDAEWERTGAVDGYVSLEVPPDVAYDAAATVAFARRLHDQAGFPNLLVKIPGTPQGLTAMEEAITAGIGVNVTLLFSDTHYLRTADAYLRALERRRRAGARPQRVLWASTSTKNPDLPDPNISAGWPPRTRSTPSRRRHCSRSRTTEASTTGSSPTTPPRNGPSQRPPTPASTPMPSVSVCNAKEPGHSPRTGPRCSPRSKKRRRRSRAKAAWHAVIAGPGGPAGAGARAYSGLWPGLRVSRKRG